LNKKNQEIGGQSNCPDICDGEIKRI